MNHAENLQMARVYEHLHNHAARFRFRQFESKLFCGVRRIEMHE
jgi:hypothetical protein